MGAERDRVDGFGRLEDGLRQASDWYLWGPYVSERQWGTVREDYSAGARWPKMTDPSGAESPSPVGPFLIWQQPHPIFYAELCYRTHSDRATLEKYKGIVFETAEFMASYPAWEIRK